MLLVVYKLFSKIITNRIANNLDSMQSREQAYFQGKFSTVDRTCAVDQVVEKNMTATNHGNYYEKGI